MSSEQDRKPESDLHVDAIPVVGFHALTLESTESGSYFLHCYDGEPTEDLAYIRSVLMAAMTGSPYIPLPPPAPSEQPMKRKGGNNGEATLSTEELAIKLGVSERTVVRETEAGRLPFLEVSERKRRYQWSQVVEALTVKPDAGKPSMSTAGLPQTPGTRGSLSKSKLKKVRDEMKDW